MASLTRRQWLVGSAGALAAGLTGALLSPGRPAAALAAAGDAELLARLQVCTPADGLARLLEGNARFAQAWRAARLDGSPEQRMQALGRIWQGNCQIDPQALVEGQRPFAAVLSCADARVDPGWLFACAAGELFQVRSAGNTAFNAAIASLEFAVGELGVPLLVVLGHSGCGAVTAALASEPLTPLLEELVTPIRASLQSGDDLTQAVQGNVRHAAGQLTARSELLSRAVDRGQLSIISAYFDLGSGQVSLL
jgi:carbonic anhydrase